MLILPTLKLILPTLKLAKRKEKKSQSGTRKLPYMMLFRTTYYFPHVRGAPKARGPWHVPLLPYRLIRHCFRVHYIRIKALLFWDGRPYPLLGFFCRLNSVPLDRDNGTFDSSNTDVVEKVNFLVAASQHGGSLLRWRKDRHSTWTEMALFWSLFTGGSFLVDFLKNEILGFDENLAVVL